MQKEDIIEIKNKIHTIRGFQVMLDRDLAELYEVKTKRLNEQVKRNIDRFPEDFMFQLTNSEKKELVAKCDHLNSLKFSYQKPHVFTEEGVAMLSGILKSKISSVINIQIMRAFVVMRRFLSKNADIFKRLADIEIKQLEYQRKTDKSFEKVFDAIENNEVKQGIFYDGQIFDAYNFLNNLIRSAKKSIILVDNYIDDTVLAMFSETKINVIIYTKNISNKLILDLDRYNSQYKSITIKEFHNSHDRFMIIDNKEVYHIGASLKDLGKRWFAFSKFDKEALKMLDRLG